jgi:hypothetical protein
MSWAETEKAESSKQQNASSKFLFISGKIDAVKFKIFSRRQKFCVLQFLLRPSPQNPGIAAQQNEQRVGGASLKKTAPESIRSGFSGAQRVRRQG